VTIPAGEESVPITVTAIDDPLAETDETVVLTVEPDAAYIVSANSEATVTIKSDELLSDLVVFGFLRLRPRQQQARRSPSPTRPKTRQGFGRSVSHSILPVRKQRARTDRPPARVPGSAGPRRRRVEFRLPLRDHSPGNAAGTWYLIAKADGEEAVVESSENE